MHGDVVGEPYGMRLRLAGEEHIGSGASRAPAQHKVISRKTDTTLSRPILPACLYPSLPLWPRLPPCAVANYVLSVAVVFMREGGRQERPLRSFMW